MPDAATQHEASLYYARLSDPKKLGPRGVSAAGKALLGYALRDIFPAIFDGSCPRLSVGTHGKPFFPDFHEIHFNISHSGNYAAVALSDIEIGLDIQEMRISDPERLARTGKRVFPEEEYRAFLACGDRRTAFFREWALREAYVKWTGEGLTRDLRSLPMDGWHTFPDIDPEYICAVQAGDPLHLTIKEVAEAAIL